jgi:hypothetical protein
MGLGLAGAYRAAGAQGALAQIRDEEAAALAAQARAEQQQFENQLKLRSAAILDSQEGRAGETHNRITLPEGLTRIRQAGVNLDQDVTEFGQKQESRRLLTGLNKTAVAAGDLDFQSDEPFRTDEERFQRTVSDAFNKSAAADVSFYGGAPPKTITGLIPRGSFSQHQATKTFDTDQDIRQARATAKPQAGAGEMDAGTIAMAEMAARNPAIMQGWTPTERAKVTRAMALTPGLSEQYENARMAPLRTSAQNILSAVDKLVDVTGGQPRLTGGARSVMGEWTPVSARDYIPGAAAADANAALKQVMGKQIVDMIADMKAQSATGATGFGNMSDRELAVLQGAATQLTQRLSEPAALEQLLIIRDKLTKVLGGGTAPPAAGGVRQRPAGVPATATWDENRRMWVP